MQWEEDIASFTISQDATLIAISNYSGYIYLVDLEKSCRLGLVKYPDHAVCGLMHFIPANNTLVCGLLYSDSEKVDHDWYLVSSRRPRYTLLTSVNEALQASSSGFPKVTLKSGDFVLWPLESSSLSEHEFLEQTRSSCWVNNLQRIFPHLLTGFYIKLNLDTALVGSPAFNYVTALDVRVLDEVNSPCPGERIMKVVFSAEGDTIYSVCLAEQSTSEVLVTISSMSSRKVLMKKIFSGLVSLIPTKEGVIVCVSQQVPELWNFELSECIRLLTKLTGNEELIPISDELVGCRRKRDMSSLDQSFRLSFDTVLELGDFSLSSIAFPDSLFYGRTENNSSVNAIPHSEVGSIPLVVDILDITNDEFATPVSTMGPGDEYTLSV